MRTNTKLMMVGIASAAILTSGGLMVKSALADTTATGTGRFGNLVQTIATKFNLNQSEVQAVFDQDQAARETERVTAEKAVLDQAVTDGKITQAQEDLIIAKQAELRATRDANREAHLNLTAEERKAAMEKERTALETWASENGISEEYLRMGLGKGMGMGQGGPMGEGRGGMGQGMGR